MYYLHHYVSAKTALERGDYDVALAQAVPIAKQGEVWALNLVGLMYLNGQGLPPNRDTGLHLVMRGCRPGTHSISNYPMGWRFLPQIIFETGRRRRQLGSLPACVSSSAILSQCRLASALSRSKGWAME
jgi:TPR repeat protein